MGGDAATNEFGRPQLLAAVGRQHGCLVSTSLTNFPFWSLRKIYEFFCRDLWAECSNPTGNHARARVVKATMSTLFLIICGVAVVFYVVFLIECSRPGTPLRGCPLPSETRVPGSVVPGFTPDPAQV